MTWGRFFRHHNSYGTWRDDPITGGAGNNRIHGLWGNDTLDGGAGSDRVYGDSGADVLVYRVGENHGAHDRYDGGTGRDTLRLEFTREEWSSDAAQADVARFLDYLQHPHYRGFEFHAFDLDVRNIEKLEVRVDGVVIDPGRQDRAVDAVNDTAAVAEGGMVGGNVIANDSVPDLVKSVQLLAGPAHGDLTFNTDGSFSYAAGGFFDSLSQNETASESFTYRVTDADGDTDTATVTVVVNGVNDAPVANADAAATDEDHAVAVDVTGNDTDVDAHDTHSVDSAVVTTGLGSVAISGSTLTYDPGAGYQSLGANASATVVVGYTMSDNHGATSSSSLTLTVNGANDRPDAVDDALDVPGGGAPSNALSVAVVYQNLTDSISATVDQLNDDTWFDFDATAVHYTSADTLAELAQFDVIVLGNSLAEVLSAGFWAALHQYVDSAEGGVVSNGWTNYNMGLVRSSFGNSTNADYDASTPITGDFAYHAGNAVFVPLAAGHPITEGLPGVQAHDYVAASIFLDAGAVSLATLDGNDTALAYQDQEGDGRTVYLGFQFTDSTYRDASMAASVEGDRLLEQAVNWAGGGGADAGSGGASGDLAFSFAASDLLANDTDVDTGDVLSLLAVSATSEQGAAVSIDADGNVVYVLGAPLTEGMIDRFSYTVSDGHGGEDSATVVLTFTSADESPML